MCRGEEFVVQHNLFSALFQNWHPSKTTPNSCHSSNPPISKLRLKYKKKKKKKKRVTQTRATQKSKSDSHKLFSSTCLGK
jgi:hypothetical protein